MNVPRETSNAETVDIFDATEEAETCRAATYWSGDAGGRRELAQTLIDPTEQVRSYAARLRAEGTGQRPPACRRGLARAPMLTSPLALRQEPLGRSVDVRPLGWRPSPDRWNLTVNQVDGG